MNPSLFTSASVEWATPQDLFDDLDATFGFTLDVCATPGNAKCQRFFTKEDCGLAQSWAGHRCWMIPPYGRDIVRWVEKAHQERCRSGVLTLGLLPARTDTKWWHRHVAPFTVRYLEGRLKFGGAQNSAPFPSALCLWW